MTIQFTNGYRIFVDNRTGEKLSSIKVGNMDIIYWSVCSSSRRGGNGVKGVNVGERYFSRLQDSIY